MVVGSGALLGDCTHDAISKINRVAFSSEHSQLLLRFRGSNLRSSLMGASVAAHISESAARCALHNARAWEVSCAP